MTTEVLHPPYLLSQEQDTSSLLEPFAGKDGSAEARIEQAAEPLLISPKSTISPSSPLNQSRKVSRSSTSQDSEENNDVEAAVGPVFQDNYFENAYRANLFQNINQQLDTRFDGNIHQARSIGIQMGQAVTDGVSMETLSRAESNSSKRKGYLYGAGTILIGVVVFALVFHNPITALVAGALLLTVVLLFLKNKNQTATIERRIAAYEKLYEANDQILKELKSEVLEGQSKGHLTFAEAQNLSDAILKKRETLGLEKDWESDLQDMRMNGLHQKKEKEVWDQHIIDLVFEYLATQEKTVRFRCPQEELFTKYGAKEKLKQFTFDQKNDLILFLKQKGAFKKTECSPVEIVSELVGIRPYFVWHCLKGKHTREKEIHTQIQPFIEAHKKAEEAVVEDDRSLFPLIEELDRAGFFDGAQRPHTYAALRKEFGLSGVQTYQMLCSIRNPSLKKKV